MKIIKNILIISSLLAFSCKSSEPTVYKYPCSITKAQFVTQMYDIISYGGFDLSKSDTSTMQFTASKMLETIGSGKNRKAQYLEMNIKFDAATQETSVQPYILDIEEGDSTITSVDIKGSPKLSELAQLSLDRIKRICKPGK